MSIFGKIMGAIFGTNADAAQYLISGKNNGNLEARATDRFNKTTKVSNSLTAARVSV